MITANDIRNIQVDVEKPDCHDFVAALAEALVNAVLDIHGQPGEAGEDAAWREIVRAIHQAATCVAFEGDDASTIAWGSLRQAGREIHREINMLAA